MPTFGNLFSIDPQVRVLRQSVDPSDSTKKECEGAWEIYKVDAGPELKNVDARDERMSLRKTFVFGNHFSLEEPFGVFQPSEVAEFLRERNLGCVHSWTIQSGFQCGGSRIF